VRKIIWGEFDPNHRRITLLVSKVRHQLSLVDWSLSFLASAEFLLRCKPSCTALINPHPPRDHTSVAKHMGPRTLHTKGRACVWGNNFLTPYCAPDGGVETFDGKTTLNLDEYCMRAGKEDTKSKTESRRGFKRRGIWGSRGV
jgi:hypothetical protein